MLLPTLQGVRDPLWTVIGQTVRDDEQAGMRLTGLEEGDSQSQEVIPVARQENSLLAGRKTQLIPISEAPPVDLMDRDDIQSEPTRDLGNRGIQVFVQKKLHP